PPETMHMIPSLTLTGMGGRLSLFNAPIYTKDAAELEHAKDPEELLRIPYLIRLDGDEGQKLANEAAARLVVNVSSGSKATVRASQLLEARTELNSRAALKSAIRTQLDSHYFSGWLPPRAPSYHNSLPKYLQRRGAASDLLGATKTEVWDDQLCCL